MPDRPLADLIQLLCWDHKNRIFTMPPTTARQTPPKIAAEFPAGSVLAGAVPVTSLREDRVTETDQHARYQPIAPQVERSLYHVPKVLE